MDTELQVGSNSGPYPTLILPGQGSGFLLFWLGTRRSSPYTIWRRSCELPHYALRTKKRLVKELTASFLKVLTVLGDSMAASVRVGH
jgi:hypothetical protein